MSNWYFECPHCEAEIGCEVDKQDGPGQGYLTVQIPDHCSECEKGLSHLWHDLEVDILEHYIEYNSEPPEKEWFEDVVFDPLGTLYFKK